MTSAPKAWVLDTLTAMTTAGEVPAGAAHSAQVHVRDGTKEAYTAAEVTAMLRVSDLARYRRQLVVPLTERGRRCRWLVSRTSRACASQSHIVG